MFHMVETVFSQVGVAGFAALWAAKAGVSYVGLRWLKQRQVWVQVQGRLPVIRWSRRAALSGGDQ